MKKRILVPLKIKITFFISVLLAIVSSLVFYYAPLEFKKEKIINFQNNTNSIANIILFNLSTNHNFIQNNTSKESLEKLFKSESIEYFVINKNGANSYEYNIDLAEQNNYTDLNNSAIAEGMEILKVHSPIMVDDAIIGDLYMGFSVVSIWEEMAEFREKIGYVSLILFLGGTLFVFIISAKFTNPLKKIMGSVKEINEGIFNELVKVKSKDEIGFIANSFNKMIKNISLAKVEMDQNNRELEKRVGVRTRELEGALKSLQKENKQRRVAEIEISNSLHEKEVLLKEIHHRVKNNLQIVSSLLFFQSKQIEDPKMLDMFRDGQNRVKSMALIHEKLYQSGDLANIDFKQYVKKLTNFLFQSYGINQAKIKFKNNVQDVELGVDTAVPFGLIINEIVSNSLKHGFKTQEFGEVKIDMGYDENNKLILIISDNGVGISEDLNIEESESLGLRLVNNLTTQLNGTITFLNNNGTTVKIVIQNSSPHMVS